MPSRPRLRPAAPSSLRYTARRRVRAAVARPRHRGSPSPRRHGPAALRRRRGEGREGRVWSEGLVPRGPPSAALVPRHGETPPPRGREGRAADRRAAAPRMESGEWCRVGSPRRALVLPSTILRVAAAAVAPRVGSRGWYRAGSPCVLVPPSAAPPPPPPSSETPPPRWVAAPRVGSGGGVVPHRPAARAGAAVRSAAAVRRPQLQWLGLGWSRRSMGKKQGHWCRMREEEDKGERVYNCRSVCLERWKRLHRFC
ncbi:hypothetical protein U9M48_021787 [Paspalum notatum var. saurae]|uniref:Uncharacterized protein n=1 Tax=Paspalum notatum var. saurae TaxID=547442 RepID=A0AAQ3TLC8_PASNO